MTLPTLLNTNNVTNVTSFASMIKNRLLFNSWLITIEFQLFFTEISEPEEI